MTVLLDGVLVRSERELIELYSKRLQVSGFSAETILYRGSDQHQRKLEVFAAVLGQMPRHDMITDVGCGYGSLLEVYEPIGPYIGIDIVPEFIEEARRRHPGREFRVQSVFDPGVEKTDWLTLAGVLSSVPDSQAMLEKCIALTRKTIVFDVTMDGRLPTSYAYLNRWTIMEVESVLDGAGFSTPEIIDVARSWVLCVSCRVSNGHPGGHEGLTFADHRR